MTEMTPVAYAAFAENGNIRIWSQEPGRVERTAVVDGFKVEPLVTLSSAQSLLAERDKRIAELEGAVDFTLSDASRLLRKQDVQGACPDPDECFYFGDRVRCGPCSVKASAAKGIVIDDTHSHLPEVCRLRRELKVAETRAASLEALVEEAKTVLEPFAALCSWLGASDWSMKHRMYAYVSPNADGSDAAQVSLAYFRAARSIAAKIGGKDE